MKTARELLLVLARGSGFAEGKIEFPPGWGHDLIRWLDASPEAAPDVSGYLAIPLTEKGRLELRTLTEGGVDEVRVHFNLGEKRWGFIHRYVASSRGEKPEAIEAGESLEQLARGLLSFAQEALGVDLSHVDRLRSGMIHIEAELIRLAREHQDAGQGHSPEVGECLCVFGEVFRALSKVRDRLWGGDE